MSMVSKRSRRFTEFSSSTPLAWASSSSTSRIAANGRSGTGACGAVQLSSFSPSSREFTAQTRSSSTMSPVRTAYSAKA